jgi:hypothetical protein
LLEGIFSYSITQNMDHAAKDENYMVRSHPHSTTESAADSESTSEAHVVAVVVPQHHLVEPTVFLVPLSSNSATTRMHPELPRQQQQQQQQHQYRRRSRRPITERPQSHRFEDTAATSDYGTTTSDYLSFSQTTTTSSHDTGSSSSCCSSSTTDQLPQQQRPTTPQSCYSAPTDEEEAYRVGHTTIVYKGIPGVNINSTIQTSMTRQLFCTLRQKTTSIPFQRNHTVIDQSQTLVPVVIIP